MMEAIGIATAVVGGVGLAIGLLLGLAGRAFHVHVDETEVAVRAQLPGNNCGGCGYAGCDALAAAIVSGEAKASACPVGGESVAHAIAEIMGAEAETVERQVAFVHCADTCDKVKREADYFGMRDCRQAVTVPGATGKMCSTACLGLGTCAAVCPAGAIQMQNGVAKVNPEKCISCGCCAALCPQHIITLIPAAKPVAVACSSRKSGRSVKASCDAGCIACGICQKVCPHDAIHVTDNLARIDHEKCTACGACVAKCPVKVIHIAES